MPGDDWAALDLREAAYDRIGVTDQVTHDLGHAPQIAVYTIPDGKHGRPTAAHPVLLSYIDVVIQGYLRMFGPDGAARFFATTDGWDVPVLNDRASPIYPRHCTLSPQERSFVDDSLNDLSAQVKNL